MCQQEAAGYHVAIIAATVYCLCLRPTDSTRCYTRLERDRETVHAGNHQQRRVKERACLSGDSTLPNHTRSNKANQQCQRPCINTYLGISSFFSNLFIHLL